MASHFRNCHWGIEVCWSRSLLAIQIDAAINPGNSGGPCFHSAFPSTTAATAMCMGVAFQVLGRDDAENIGYIIPSEAIEAVLGSRTKDVLKDSQVVKHFLVDFVKNGKYTGFGSCGFAWQPLENLQSLGISMNRCFHNVNRLLQIRLRCMVQSGCAWHLAWKMGRVASVSEESNQLLLPARHGSAEWYGKTWKRFEHTGFFKKTAIQHTSHCYQSSPCPPLLNVACVSHAAETQWNTNGCFFGSVARRSP